MLWQGKGKPPRAKALALATHGHESEEDEGGSAEQQSQITSVRPFPNEHPPLWATWGEFFKAAEKLSEPVEGMEPKRFFAMPFCLC